MRSPFHRAAPAAVCVLLLCFSGLVWPGASAWAQEGGEALSPGARLRVFTTDPTRASWTGDVESVRPEGFMLRVKGRADPVSIPYEDVTRLDLRVGRRTRDREGLVIGLALGALVGALVRDGGLDGERVLNNGLWGASLGALCGRFIRVDRWRTVPIEHLAPAGPRATLGFTLRF
jgi:hypothetical protein